ncbi:AcrR family transcriptional regulator [Mycolicibacterium sp. BK556]|uniref:TetR/AcrR family transcriptional regulator n=1 Tax=unclassified Mycolicibacterium TaxID=2636767 RepID=UPI00161AFA74|nr:AcrR family transcriptional regulator [Mycolicibacterium sp. BK556]MBB3632244.1 AcrR family transcriptional regulator [Mycolicibacterium sp. BK607]
MIGSEPVGKRRNVRRAPDEVRALALKAAHRLFSAQGYHATTTRQIADEAGVGESVIFRHFGSKAELFETTILTPFGEFVDEWVTTWDARTTATADLVHITETFVKGFFNLADEHQELLRTLVAARIDRSDPGLTEVAARVGGKLAGHLGLVRRSLLEHGEARHFRNLDAPVSVAMAVGSVLSLVLIDDWLFAPDQRRPGKTRQIREATQMLLYGVTGSAAPRSH